MLMLGAGAAEINPLQITPSGVIIAVLFLISIVGVLAWMLRLPEETESMRTAVKAVRTVNKQTRILVPLLSQSEVTDRVVAIAAQMVRPRDGIVDLLAVIEVPFTLPLDASVEEDEKEAYQVLERAESVAMRCGNGNGRNGNRIKKRILKARKAGAAIVREAEEHAVDMILMPNMPVSGRGGSQQIDPAVDYVLKHAPCEVMVLSPGLAETSEQNPISHMITEKTAEAVKA